MNLILTNQELNEAINLYLANKVKDVHTYEISTEIVVGRATPGNPRTGARAEVTMPRREEYTYLDDSTVGSDENLAKATDNLIKEDKAPFDVEPIPEAAIGEIPEGNPAQVLPQASMSASLFNRNK